MESFVEPTVRRSSGKSRLMEAAHRLFGRASYDDVSVAEVLAFSGLKAPSLYHHFGDKEGLYYAWVESATQSCSDAITKIESNGDALDELIQVADVLTKTHALDILQLRKDLSRMRDKKRSREFMNLLDTVLLPLIKEKLDLAAKSGQLSQTIDDRTELFIHTIMFNHPNYAKLNRPISSFEERSSQALVEWFCSTNLPAKR